MYIYVHFISNILLINSRLGSLRYMVIIIILFTHINSLCRFLCIINIDIVCVHDYSYNVYVLLLSGVLCIIIL